MNYNYRYRLNPTDALEERLAWTVDTCRQVYNHFLHRLNRVDDSSAYSEQKRLPDLKDWWTDLKHVHSKVLQKVVQRLYDNLSTLRGCKDNGYHVGTLNWKGTHEYRSFTYSQSGFELKNTSGRTRLWLSKLGEIPLTFHRDLPDDVHKSEALVQPIRNLRFLRTPTSRPSRSSRNQPASGTPSSASKRPTTRPRNPTNSPA